MIRRILNALTAPITDRLDHVLEQLGDLDAAVADIDGDAWTELAAVQVALGKHYTGSVVDGVKGVVAMLEAPRASLANYVATLADIRTALGRHAHPQFTTVENVRGLVVAYEGEREQTSLAHQAAGEVSAEMGAEIQRLKAKLDEVEDHRDTATEAAKAHRRELDILHPHIARLLKIDNSCDVGAAVDRAEQNRKTRFAHARELVDVRTALKPWTDGHQNHDNAGTVVSELVAEWQRITQAEDAGNEEVNRLVTKLAAERDCGQEGVCATAPGCARHWQERSRELVADRDKLAQENTRLAGDLTYAQRELRLVTDERKVQARKTPNEAITRLMAVHGYTGGPGGWQREGGPVWPLETAIEGIELAARATEPAPCYRCNASDSGRLYFWTCRECLNAQSEKLVDKLDRTLTALAISTSERDVAEARLVEATKTVEARLYRGAHDSITGNREALGRIVRWVWIAWAKEQPNPKPSWLVPWEGLSEPDKEVDRRIGERLAAEGLAILATRIIVTPDKAAALREAGWEERVSGWSPDGGYSAWTLDGAYDAMVAARGKAPGVADDHAALVAFAADLATTNPFTAERFMQLALLNADWQRDGLTRQWQHPRGYEALYNTEAAFECMLADRAVPSPRDTLADPRPGDLYVEIGDETELDDADIWMVGTIRGLSPADVIKYGPDWIRPATPEEAAKIRKDNGL